MEGKDVKWRRAKCGSAEFRKKRVRLSGSAGFFNPLEATAYICSKCGYAEFYVE